MRLSALFLLVLPLCFCEEEGVEKGFESIRANVTIRDNITEDILNGTDSAEMDMLYNTTEPCLDGAEPAEKAKLYDALNGECSDYKESVNSCCQKKTDCLKCRLDQAKCMKKIHFANVFCQVRTNYIVKSDLSEIISQFHFVPSYGVSRELYGNCTAASLKIHECAVALQKCINTHGRRKEKRREGEREPYECSDQGDFCLQDVRDIDRSYECAREVGYATEVMERRWKAKVDGNEDDKEEVSSASAHPFTSVIEHMQKSWGISWWGAFAIIVGGSLAITGLLCWICYCCAMAGLARQKQQRRWKRAQERKEHDRYSTESDQPSSVHVSRYEESTE